MFYCWYFFLNSQPFIPSFLPLLPFFSFLLYLFPFSVQHSLTHHCPSLPPVDYPPPSAQEDNGCVVVHFCTRCAESSPIKYLGEVSGAAEGSRDPPIVTVPSPPRSSPLRHPSPSLLHHPSLALPTQRSLSLSSQPT